jgi:predicted protein tyrosine phosphatase
MEIIISSLYEMHRHRGRATHLISEIDQEDLESVPPMGLSPYRVLTLVCHDVDSAEEARSRRREMPGSSCIAPTLAMVKAALAFAKNLSPSDCLLIHCGHGISRSTAITWAILCQQNPKAMAAESYAQLLALRPQAVPNRLIVKYADRLLKQRGCLLRLLDEIM